MSDVSWLSPVDLLSSAVLGLNLEINQEFEGEETSSEVTLNTQFDEITEDENSYVCRGMVEGIQTAAETGNPDNRLFHVSCRVGVIVGIAKDRVPDEFAEADLKRTLESAVLSLGYGKVRTIIEGITADSAIYTVSLPAINAKAYMDVIASE